MTTVQVRRDENGVCGLKVKGHAGYAEEGSDIVCSGVSAITQTAAMGIIEVLGISAGLDISDGNLYLILPDDITDADFEKASIILDTMAMGLRSIAATYGDYINISERKV